MADHIAARLRAPGPKRILALDGGGTRGIVSIAFLAEIERVLQRRLSRNDDFVLSDYFDLIGGTSVGSILATLLARGWRVAAIEETFRKWSPEIFKSRWLGELTAARFDAAKLSDKVIEVVGDEPMKWQALKTGLVIVSKRADTNSVWVITNNPNSRYWVGDDGAIDNGEYKIRDVIRASTAAPTFYQPMEMKVRHTAGDGFTGRFIDGAVSPHNNPALQLYLLASVRGYNLGGAPIEEVKAGRGRAWALGPDDLMMISVGTGSFPTIVKKRWLAQLEAIEALKSMIGDAEQLTLAIMQGLSRPRLRWQIDSEVGDLAADQMFAGPLLHFQRYDVRLTAKWLSGNGPIDDVRPGNKVQAALREHSIDLPRDIRELQQLINVPVMAKLHALAAAAAREQVSDADFPDAFDAVWAAKPRVERFCT